MVKVFFLIERKEGDQEEIEEKEYTSESDESEMTDDEEEEVDEFFLANYSPRYLESRLFDSIMYDKKDMLVMTLKVLKRVYKGFALRICYDPFSLIFTFDSVNCLKPVLNGETTRYLEFNGVNAVPLVDSNERLVPILHKAAGYGAFEITKLCLPGNEEQLNLRVHIDQDLVGMKGVLPLNLALENLTCSKTWRSDSIPMEPQLLLHKLIFHCNRFKSTSKAELVRLLAVKTVETEQEFFDYLKEPRLRELTFLLIFVVEDMAGNAKSTFDNVVDSDEDTQKKKKVEMEAIELLLELFDRVGDKIEACLRQTDYYEGASKLDLIRQLSRLLKEAGFDAGLELDEIEREGIIIFNKDIPESHRLVEESNIESKQLSTHDWLVDKQDSVSVASLNYKPIRNFSSLGLSCTHHFVSGCRCFGSTTVADKVKGGLLKPQLKKQYQDSNVRSWASSLQFIRECALSANSSRRILWIANKLGRAL
ncbi:OLC1v1004489C1 [Oldenlandia corymbosa var. corymbosa]|uniref:OLC1v1004489C1 n=1 Tax=Oldenlandia corymbosa var. corymbosa TaxID=529605 RepID=A0AAV1DEU3_OLDCO|nr:OLC1v1004489C1 [Oldenlandia corymbosa var. corymbosa]